MTAEVADGGFRNTAPEVAPRVKGFGHDGSPEVAPRTVSHEGPEVASPTDVDSFTARLSRLGAPLDVIDAVRAHWDEEWDPQDIPKDQLVRLGDDELRQLIAGVEREHRESTMTEEEQAAADHERAVAEARPEAERLVAEGATVDTLVEWVGDDRAKAQAVAEAEQTTPGHEQRVTLMRHLSGMLNADEG